MTALKKFICPQSLDVGEDIDSAQNPTKLCTASLTRRRIQQPNFARLLHQLNLKGMFIISGCAFGMYYGFLLFLDMGSLLTFPRSVVPSSASKRVIPTEAGASGLYPNRTVGPHNLLLVATDPRAEF